MPTNVIRERIRRPAADVFEFVGANGYQNNPRWEKEVLSWSEVTPLPVRKGTTALMHREDDGKRRDVHLLCTEFEPGRRVAWQHTDPGPFRFAISFETTPTGASETELVVQTDITLSGPLRLMAPLFARRQAKTGARLMGEVKRLLES